MHFVMCKYMQAVVPLLMHSYCQADWGYSVEKTNFQEQQLRISGK